MRNILLFTAAFLLVATAAPAQQQTDPTKQQYSTVIDGLPLMQGMTEDQQKDAAPVKPGKAEHTTATITGNDKMVKSYYNEQLSKDGWKANDTHTEYEKDGQRIKIKTDFQNGQTTVNFTEIPAPPPQNNAPATPQGN